MHLNALRRDAPWPAGEDEVGHRVVHADLGRLPAHLEHPRVHVLIELVDGDVSVVVDVGLW
jgi:hypothetical protein